MKITSYKESSIPEKISSSLEKPFSKLSQGEIFKAQIADIQQGKVLLRLNDGNYIEAKLQNQILEMKIGQTMLFKVQTNTKDQILIETLKNQTENPKLTIVLDALDAAKLFMDSENIKMVETLLDNQLPIDSHNLQEIFHQLKSNPNLSLEEVIFFLNNEIQIDEKNILQLKGYVEHNINLEKQIEQLFNNIEQIEDSSFKLELLNALAELKNTNDIQYNSSNNYNNTNQSKLDVLTLKNEIEILTYIKDNYETLVTKTSMEDNSLLVTKALSEEIKSILSNDNKMIDFFTNELKSYLEFNMKNDEIGSILSNKTKEFLNKIQRDIRLPLEKVKNQDSINDSLNKLYKHIVEIENIAKKTESLQAKEILSSSEQIKNNLDFMNQLNKYQSYVQIPIRIDNQNTQADLYVFRKKKHKKNTSHGISALIALDLKNLGYLEAFIQKNNKDIYCQFRLENELYKNIFRKYAQELGNTLSIKGYNLKSITFHQLKERFNIIKPPEDDLKLPEEVKRYSFDMRV